MRKAFLIKLLSVNLALAILVSSSLVVLAGPNANVMGELTVSGKVSNGEAPFVLVNGERAQSGRTILSSGTITTEDSSATLNFGKAGSVEIAPNSSVAININGSEVSGSVVSGKVKAFGALANSIRTGANSQTSSGANKNWWIWAVVFGGAAAALIYTASNSNSSSTSGGGSVSPTR